MLLEANPLVPSSVAAATKAQVTGQANDANDERRGTCDGRTDYNRKANVVVLVAHFNEARNAGPGSFSWRRKALRSIIHKMQATCFVGYPESVKTPRSKQVVLVVASPSAESDLVSLAAAKDEIEIREPPNYESGKRKGDDGKFDDRKEPMLLSFSGDVFDTVDIFKVCRRARACVPLEVVVLSLSLAVCFSADQRCRGVRHIQSGMLWLWPPCWPNRSRFCLRRDSKAYTKAAIIKIRSRPPMVGMPMRVVRKMASSWVQVAFPVQLKGGSLGNFFPGCMDADQSVVADCDVVAEPGSAEQACVLPVRSAMLACTRRCAKDARCLL